MAGPHVDRDAAHDPCADLLARATDTCAEALRLAELATERAGELRRARHAAAEPEWAHELTAGLTGRHAIFEAKQEASRRYREHRLRNPGPAGARAAAAAWLGEIDRLNRQSRTAPPPPTEHARRTAETDQQLERLGTAADAARIAAARAAEECQATRRLLGLCQERQTGHPAATDTTVGPASAVVALLHGDDAVLEALAERAAGASGLARTDARRLLLLLRDAITDAALGEAWLTFPSGHPFWGSLSTDDARGVARALASLGNGFDGRGGWSAGHAPDTREFAMALAQAGYDIRGFRHPAGRAEVESLWDGTVVDAAGLLAHTAADLSLDRMLALVGVRAAALGTLWSHWGSIRPLLLAAPS